MNKHRGNIFAVIIFVSMFGTISSCSGPAEKFRQKGEKHLKNIRKLTAGGENAEAYLSFDEKSLIFQATRPGMSCDQIFIMDLDGKNKRLISSGQGRATCSYFLPGDKRIVYSSTYRASKKCPPPPDRSKGYVWKLYDSFEIYSADARTGQELKQLTSSPGYDAEATVSPRGDKILFTSTRDGDPEIYVMDIDGSNQKRLTFARGYDGGAFFSRDGKKIVFRASRPRGAAAEKDYRELIEKGYVRPGILEIYVMDADGKNPVQVTNFGKASFAPFFHPDGKRIIFSSNYKSKNARNFDLYMIGIDGKNLERITFNASFDRFPVFSADGKTLIFASNRLDDSDSANARAGETNIFIADWLE